MANRVDFDTADIPPRRCDLVAGDIFRLKGVYKVAYIATDRGSSICLQSGTTIDIKPTEEIVRIQTLKMTAI